MSPRVVCNSSPLIALASIGHLDLLRTLFARILVPEAVRREVVDEGRGRPGAAEVADASWIEVAAVRDRAAVDALRAEMDEGEAEAIQLAREVDAELVLLDNREPRRSATALGLAVMGTGGVLAVAYRQGHLPDLQASLRELRQRGFWLADAVVAALLRGAGTAGGG